MNARLRRTPGGPTYREGDLIVRFDSLPIAILASVLTLVSLCLQKPPTHALKIYLWEPLPLAESEDTEGPIHLLSIDARGQLRMNGVAVSDADL